MRSLFKKIMSEHLRQWLVERQLTQADLARLTNISTSTINDYVNGHTTVSRKNQKKLELVLGQTIEELYVMPSHDTVRCHRQKQDSSKRYYDIKAMITLRESDVCYDAPFFIGDRVILASDDYSDLYFYCYQNHGHYVISSRRMSQQQMRQVGIVIGISRK